MHTREPADTLSNSITNNTWLIVSDLFNVFVFNFFIFMVHDRCANENIPAFIFIVVSRAALSLMAFQLDEFIVVLVSFV